MTPSSDDGRSEASPEARVDEKVVRKMLQVNPSLRDGRTTFQVKQDMEKGQGVTADRRASGGESVHKVSEPPAPSGEGGARGELDDTITYFIRGKTEALNEAKQSIAERRAALDEEERKVDADLRSALASFIGLLDPTAVAMHGVSCLSKHKAFLEAVGLTPAQVLEMARKAKK